MGKMQGTETELASTVLLVVEPVFPDEFPAPLLKSALPPVPVPPHYIIVECGGFFTCTVYLVQTFPPRGGKGGGDYLVAMLMCISGCRREPQSEAFKAA